LDQDWRAAFLPEFMEMALNHPELGYYMSGNEKNGSMVTSLPAAASARFSVQ